MLSELNLGGPESQFQPAQTKISAGPGVTAVEINFFCPGLTKAHRRGAVCHPKRRDGGGGEISSCCRCEIQGFQEEGAVLLQL